MAERAARPRGPHGARAATAGERKALRGTRDLRRECRALLRTLLPREAAPEGEGCLHLILPAEPPPPPPPADPPADGAPAPVVDLTDDAPADAPAATVRALLALLPAALGRRAADGRAGDAAAV